MATTERKGRTSSPASLRSLSRRLRPWSEHLDVATDGMATTATELAPSSAEPARPARPTDPAGAPGRDEPARTRQRSLIRWRRPPQDERRSGTPVAAASRSWGWRMRPKPSAMRGK